MKSSTLLDSAVFRLTPTRTRCDLIITANGKTEKIASGLLNPFLSHLKTAQEQIAKGGYSIILEPEPDVDASWFTKATVERFVRFVSNPEVLERIYTIESEILQIGEAIAIQVDNETGLSSVEDHKAKSLKIMEGSKTLPDMNEEKAIVLYEPGTHPPAANGSTAQEGNSKLQLLRTLEARKTVLQKEQGMAFARAVAAGFDVDHMAPLISFAECFGASRLMDACLRFMDLWKAKHETGQWLEIEATEALPSQPNFYSTSGIVLSNMGNTQKEVNEPWHESSKELATEDTGNAGTGASADGRLLMGQQVPPGNQEYFQGQFPHSMFPPWPIHSPPGAVPVYQAYPMQGMPYYQSYPGNGPFFQPQYSPAEDSRFSSGGQRAGQKRHSMDSRHSNNEPETWEMDASKTRSIDESASDNEASQSRGSRRKTGRSGKTKPGTVVIRNINYITEKKHNSSGSESHSAPGSETDEDAHDVPQVKDKNSLRSSTGNGKEMDGGNWLAFQNCLMRENDEDQRAVDQGMFAMEKGVRVKRRQNTVGDDPLALDSRDLGETREGRSTEFQKINGKVTRVPRTSNDAILISQGGTKFGGDREFSDGQFTESEGKRKPYGRAGTDDFIFHGRDDQYNPSGPLSVNGFEGSTSKLDRGSSLGVADESFIVPLRSISLGGVGTDGRTTIDVDSEIPPTLRNSDNQSNRIGSQLKYEPDDMSLVPERGTVMGSNGYDPALDYEMQARDEDGGTMDRKGKELVVDVKQGSKMVGKTRMSTDTTNKKKIIPTRREKPSKLSPLDEARARAEKLRSFKADLQKVKKEKEEEEMKRLEALKIERQKRIAARGGSIPAQSPLPTRKQLPTKLSPNSNKGSKFSDTDHGSSSPLQGFSTRTSLGHCNSQKTSKPSKSNTGSLPARNRLTQSASSLLEPKIENHSVPDPKASMARIRRLSEPKMSSHVSSGKLRGSEPIAKPKISDGHEMKNMHAIMNLDRTKAATLPELKIRTPGGSSGTVQNKSAKKETSQKVNVDKPSGTSESSTQNRKNENVTQLSGGDDNLIVEKTVVMLEHEKPNIVAVPSLEENIGVSKGHKDEYRVGEKTEVAIQYAAIRAPVSPPTMDEFRRESIEFPLQEPLSSTKGMAVHAERVAPKNIGTSTAEKQYQAPYARTSSLEDPCTVNLEYGRAPPTSLDMTANNVETKVLISDLKNLKLEKIPEVSEKPSKESSKGFRRLLMFGRKNHNSSGGEHNESDSPANVYVADDNITGKASSSAVHTLKNLISQEETPTRSTAQKSARSFSLLSPFRSKNAEKKQSA